MIKVIGAGMGRTGTKSLQEALTLLGYKKCYHMGELFLNPHGIKYWNEAATTRNTDWDGLFKGYEAAVDLPTSMFYKELSDKYPDAKVILTVRDPESWYASALRTVYAFEPSLKSKFALLLNAPFRSTARNIIKVGRFNQSRIFNEFFEGRFEDKDYTISKFMAHNEEVKRVIPKERLLVFQSSEGWGPLCEFLNHEIPDTPYPTSNSSDSFYAWADGLIGKALKLKSV